MKNFQSVKIIKQYRQLNLAPPEKVFPLLCPVREADWLEHWQYRMIYSESGLIEKGCVFSTPNENGKASIWTVTEHQPKAYKVAFAKWTPGEQVALIRIRLSDNGNETTTTEIEYEFTSLNDQQSQFLSTDVHDYFKNMMVYWEKAINHYLTTGEMYRD